MGQFQFPKCRRTWVGLRIVTRISTEYRPNIDSEHFNFGLSAGGERKETGSYYTPPVLVDQLIETTVVPVVEDRLAGKESQSEKERALLGIRVIDPASGSGHFILAAGRRLADVLVDIRHGTREPTRAERQTALRDVIRRCLYAVDKNPLAVDLCMFSLWLEGQSRGKPLTFLESHITCADSLVGVFDLEILKRGIPDGAFKPVDGDDRDYARSLLQTNRSERSSRGTQVRLGEEIKIGSEPDFVEGLDGLTAKDVVDLVDLRTKRGRLRALRNEERYRSLRSACDAWTESFFARLDGTASVRTSGHVFRSLRGGHVDSEFGVDFRPMHWPLIFPEVINNGGFDVVLGNPPWERIKLQEREYFAGRHAGIEGASTAALRRRLIARLDDENPDLATKYRAAKHNSDCTGKFLRSSERFPDGSKGDINTYAVFAELIRDLLRPTGRAGFIVPSGIATDATTKDLFASLVDTGQLVSLYDFENRRGMFSGVHRSYKFCLITLAGSEISSDTAHFAFSLREIRQLQDPDKNFELSGNDFKLFNPITKTCPIFRSRYDAEIIRDIYHRFSILDPQDENEDRIPWDVEFSSMFHMANDSNLFESDADLSLIPEYIKHGNIITTNAGLFVPLYEGKMVDAYDHRAASVITTNNLRRPGQPVATSDSEHKDPNHLPMPQYWVRADATQLDRESDWLLAIKSVTSPTNKRTVIAAALPPVAMAHSMLRVGTKTDNASENMFLLAIMNSYIFDYIVRQKMGGINLSLFILRQIALPSPSILSQNVTWKEGGNVGDWISTRVLALSCVATDMDVMNRSVGRSGDIVLWDPSSRLELRCELDAAMFLLYGLGREEIVHIMDTFPIVRREEESEWGEYRTKRLILERYEDFETADAGAEPQLGSA